jgi:SAM-dependent methyltransferase
LPFADETFDVCTCISVLEHLPPEHRLRALRELWRVTKRGGRLIVTCDVALESGAEGLEFEEIVQLLETARALGAKITIPVKLNPAKLLTPQNPGFGLCPVRYRGWIVRRGLTAKLLRSLGASLPGFQRIACLLWSLTRT